MKTKSHIPKHTLPVIVLAQFCGTSLWFSGNAIIDSLVQDFSLSHTAGAHLTSAVQLGFILGTLVFAFLSIADRFSPSRVFVVSAIIAALFNLGVIWDGNTLTTLLTMRFFTGFFLAGIYPVGMKIAADYYDKGLGRSLGFLVGALVLGTAFPHIVKQYLANTAWPLVIIITSTSAVAGGTLLNLLIPNGPYRKQGQKIHLHELIRVFKNKKFRDAAFGYFGHMWELYAFWALVPAILHTYNDLHPDQLITVSAGSFAIIGIGSLACIAGGYISQKIGVAITAKTSLLLSALCCLLAPWVFTIDSSIVALVFLCIWGMLVIADSPLFSTLVAHNATATHKGTAITLVTCIGFAVTIVSIQIIAALQKVVATHYLLPLLAIGPLLGLLTTCKNSNSHS